MLGYFSLSMILRCLLDPTAREVSHHVYSRLLSKVYLLCSTLTVALYCFKQGWAIILA